MFVPIEPYHAGGGMASFAPLGQHLEEFEWALAQYFGFGVMCVFASFNALASP